MKCRMAAILILIQIFSFTACWDSTETERLAVVTLLGIGLDSENKIEVTIQETGEKNKSNFNVFNESGDTISEAVEKMALNQHHRIYFGHTKVVILSEELASTKGIVPVIDFFQREGEIRPTAKLLVSKNEQLNRIFSSDFGFSSDTGTILEETLKNRKNSPNALANNINDFIELLASPGCEAFTAGIGLKIKDVNIASKSSANKNEIFDLSSIAIFKDTKMTDWLTGDEARGFWWVKGNPVGGLVSISFGNKKLSSRIVRGRSNIKPSINGDKIYIDINTNVICNIEESQFITDFLNEPLLREIEEAQNEKIKEEVSAAVKKSLSLKQDIFGFGKYIYASYPAYFVKNTSYYKDININIKVSSTVRNIRINYKPLIRQ